MKVYSIRDWDRHFENNRSRDITQLRWVAMPNKHDGEGYARVMAHDLGLAIFGAFILIVEVASKCRPRGTLLRDDGTPHTAATIALKTRCKETQIQMALDFLSTSPMDWIESHEHDGTPASGGRQVGAQKEVIEDSERSERIEGMEGREEAANSNVSLTPAGKKFFECAAVYSKPFSQITSERNAAKRLANQLGETYGADNAEAVVRAVTTERCETTKDPVKVLEYASDPKGKLKETLDAFRNTNTDKYANGF